jgi:tetratricopeptide (TPR) repeat protein
LDRYPEALADFTQAIKLDPLNAWSYNNRAWTYFNSADYKSALVDFNKAVQLDPTLQDAINGQGQTVRVIPLMY